MVDKQGGRDQGGHPQSWPQGARPTRVRAKEVVQGGGRGRAAEGARRGRARGKGGQHNRGIDSCGDDARWMMGRKGWRMGVFRWAQVGAGRERCGRSKLLAGPSQPSSFRETARTRRWLLRGQQYETAMASGCRRRCWSAEPARLFPGETRILLVEGPWSCAALSYIAPT